MFASHHRAHRRPQPSSPGLTVLALVFTACFDPSAREGEDTPANPATNAAPAGLAVTIDPAAPVDDDALTCAIVTEAVDPNRDQVSYGFAWAVDGADSGLTTPTVAAALTSGGQSWTCTVTPTDGTLDGTSASASVTIAQNEDGPIAYFAANGAEMVAIPAGTFTMGGGVADAENEYVDHQVTLTRAFWVGKSEVTRDEWEQDPDNVAWTYYSTDCVFGDCPADSLDWLDAVLYANWLSDAEGLAKCYLSDGSDLAPAYLSDPYQCPGYRLLTEAEWEYAARAGVDTTYSGSNIAGDVAWYYDNSEAYGYTSQRTCTLAPNAWELCDMSGNEWEWVGDWYSDTFGGYGDGEASVDPTGPASAGARRYRGGCWDSAHDTLRLVKRGGAEPYKVYGGVGLRLARSYPGASVDSDGDGYAGVGGDCDDGDAAINPGEVEDCSTAADDNCNGIPNDQDAPGCTEFYADGDGDGYGDPAIARCRCPPPAAGEVTNNSDRDDSDAGYH